MDKQTAKRNIIWFNKPFSKNSHKNWRYFFNLDKRFPRDHKFTKFSIETI